MPMPLPPQLRECGRRLLRRADPRRVRRRGGAPAHAPHPPARQAAAHEDRPGLRRRHRLARVRAEHGARPEGDLRAGQKLRRGERLGAARNRVWGRRHRGGRRGRLLRRRARQEEGWQGRARPGRGGSYGLLLQQARDAGAVGEAGGACHGGVAALRCARVPAALAEAGGQGRRRLALRPGVRAADQAHGAQAQLQRVSRDVHGDGRRRRRQHHVARIHQRGAAHHEEAGALAQRGRQRGLDRATPRGRAGGGGGRGRRRRELADGRKGRLRRRGGAPRTRERERGPRRGRRGGRQPPGGGRGDRLVAAPLAVVQPAHAAVRLAGRLAGGGARLRRARAAGGQRLRHRARDQEGPAPPAHAAPRRRAG